jgi:cytochrome c biogenesis protein CcdA
MMAGIAGVIAGLLSSGNAFAIPLVTVFGFFATLRNPCAVPLYPAAVGVCAHPLSAQLTDGGSAVKQRSSFLSACAFILGMATSIAVLGLAAVAAGRVIGIGHWGRYVIALVPIATGMQRLGWIHIPFLEFNPAKAGIRPGMIGAFVTGLLLSLVVGRCGSGSLAVLLSYAAYHRSFLYGGMLLFAYGVGAGIPLLTFGSLVGRINGMINRTGYRRFLDWAMGGMSLALGLYMLWIA